MTQPAILVSTWDNGLFLVTSDSLTQEIANQPVRGLTSDEQGNALAIVGGHSLCRREPTGQWTAIATSESDLACCMSVGNTIYVGTDDARVLRWPGQGSMLEILDGFDNVDGRHTWFAGSAIINGQRVGPPLGIRSLAAAPDGSVLFANVHVGGIPRSLDHGETWQPTIDIHSDVHEVSVYSADPRIVAAAADVGLCTSRDSGATWTVDRAGLHASHCSAVAFSGDHIIFSAAADPFASHGRVYSRSIKPDGCIEPLGNGMPAWTEGIVHTGCMYARGRFAAMADRAANLYLSDDYGRSWSHRSTGLPPPSGVLIC